jgi:hypothetical protein
MEETEGEGQCHTLQVGRGGEKRMEGEDTRKGRRRGGRKRVIPVQANMAAIVPYLVANSLS